MLVTIRTLVPRRLFVLWLVKDMIMRGSTERVSWLMPTPPSLSPLLPLLTPPHPLSSFRPFPCPRSIFGTARKIERGLEAPQGKGPAFSSFLLLPGTTVKYGIQPGHREGGPGSSIPTLLLSCLGGWARGRRVAPAPLRPILAADRTPTRSSAVLNPHARARGGLSEAD